MSGFAQTFAGSRPDLPPPGELLRGLERHAPARRRTYGVGREAIRCAACGHEDFPVDGVCVACGTPFLTRRRSLADDPSQPSLFLSDGATPDRGPSPADPVAVDVPGDGVARQHYGFSAKLPAALVVESGDKVVFDCQRAPFKALERSQRLDIVPFAHFNAVTGPVAVSGARRGDTLRIDVESIEITEAWGVVYPGFGPLGASRPDIRQLRIEGDRLRVSERVSLPLAPCIGSVGVAPFHGVASALSPARATGGNMDLAELRAGSTLWLPVETRGALLSVGDLHAAMSRGEPLSVGIEAAGRVTLKVAVEREHPRGLFLRDSTGTYFLGQNRHEAVDHANAYLRGTLGFTEFEAHTSLAAVGDLFVAGPALGAHARLLHLPADLIGD